MVLPVFTENAVLIRIIRGFSRSDKLIVIHRTGKFKPFHALFRPKNTKKDSSYGAFFNSSRNRMTIVSEDDGN